MQDQSLWQNQKFRALFASAAVTNLGDGVMALAVPWLATLLTRDPFLIGLVATARSLPWFLFALPAGVITDRHDHRRLLIGADAVRVALSLCLLVLALTATPGTGPVLAMAGLTFVLGSAEVVRDNTAQTFLPSVVDKRHLEQANGALWSTEQLAGQFIGPPLAGLLIGLSVGLPFGLHAGLLALGIALTMAIAVPRRVASANPPALRAPLPVVAALVALDGFAGMMWNIAQVSYRQRHIPGPLLSRVNAAFRFIGTGPAAFGAFAFGALVAWGDTGAQSGAEWAGVETGEAVLLPYAVAAVVGAALTLYAGLRLRLE